MKYTYTTKYPRPNSVEQWEVGLPPGHRLVVRKRIDHLTPKPKNFHYQARCTCKQFKSEIWTREQRVLRGIFMQHVNMVRRQGSLGMSGGAFSA